MVPRASQERAREFKQVRGLGLCHGRSILKLFRNYIDNKYKAVGTLYCDRVVPASGDRFHG